ncbi:MAG: Bax inhibitor-1/YccA family membrane protein [Patescibacteria group bacterium]
MIIFKPKTAPALAPVYAILEGGFLAAISLFYASMYDGIIVQAV